MTGRELYEEARDVGHYGAMEFGSDPWPLWPYLDESERQRWERRALVENDKLIEDAAHDYRGIGDGS